MTRRGPRRDVACWSTCGECGGVGVHAPKLSLASRADWSRRRHSLLQSAPSARRRASQMAEDYRLPGLPRYVRVNTLKIGRGGAEKALKTTGHFFCPDPKHPGHRAFYRDSDVPDLLVFKPKGQSDISRVPMVASGEVVVQQKASCFPAVALAPPPGAHAIITNVAFKNPTRHHHKHALSL